MCVSFILCSMSVSVCEWYVCMLGVCVCMSRCVSVVCVRMVCL
jgi:hypothetical protein